jgi:hypothetical protein
VGFARIPFACSDRKEFWRIPLQPIAFAPLNLELLNVQFDDGRKEFQDVARNFGPVAGLNNGGGVCRNMLRPFPQVFGSRA